MASNFPSTPIPTNVETGKSFIRPVYQFLKRTRDLTLIPKATGVIRRTQSLKVHSSSRDGNIEIWNLSKIRFYFETGDFKTANRLDNESSPPNFLLPREKKEFHIGMLPYLTDIFKNEKAKEEVYAKWWSKPLSDINIYKKRRELVKWVCTTGVILKYPAETVHSAVFIIDAYLREQKVSSNEWRLLGITALHIAGKLEEPLPERLSRLISLSGQHVFRDAVFSMEKKILVNLQFDVYPPLPTFFAQMVLLGGDLQFPSKSIHNHIVDLTMGILYNALMQPSLFSVKPSVKAQAAVETAINYIYQQHRAFKDRDLSRYAFVTPQPGKEVGEFAVSICTDSFQQRFVKPKRLFSNAPRMSIDISSPKRNVKAK